MGKNDAVLIDMVKEFKKAPAIYQPSKFWQDLNALHFEYLSTTGFNYFKRSVNNRYFNWGAIAIIVHQIFPILKEVFRCNISIFTKTKFYNYRLGISKNIKNFNFFSAFLYRIYLACLYEYVLQYDKLNLLSKLNEPSAGNPYIVRYKGKAISQDLCNSIHEFYSMTEGTILPSNPKIAELGAGYGRVGYVLLKSLEGASYCVIDFPPALFISQTYLSKILPKEKIFKFRPFKSFREVRKEFEESRIQFIMPHQIELLPKKYFDLFLNISSLHEMTRKQIKNYMKHINELCKGYFYTKQWRKSLTKDNGFIKENEYPKFKNWDVIKRRGRHPIQNFFFDTLYKIN